jgi:glycerol-3-phosphate dehydrogenase (NAD(P)+)
MSVQLKAAVLGAGYMGSAITFPLSDNHIKVNLWGTWLDDKLVESSIKGFHPKLKKALPENVSLYYWQDLDAALEDVNIIFIAVTSEGFVNIFQKTLDILDNNKDYTFFKLTKGFVEHKGKIVRATEAAFDIYAEKFPDKELKIASVGGPVRAIDLSQRVASASMYGLSDSKMKDTAISFCTDYYRIFTKDDIKSVELCSAFKNIYAMAAGICDGLYSGQKESFYYNTVSFLFNQACLEIAEIVKSAGGNSHIAFDLAGIGDLHVTSTAGRNRRFGELVGKGMEGQDAFNEMYEMGEYGEGYIALKLALPWIKSEIPGIIEKTPLLSALNNIIFNKCEPAGEFTKLISNLGG